MKLIMTAQGAHRSFQARSRESLAIMAPAPCNALTQSLSAEKTPELLPPGASDSPTCEPVKED